MVKSVLLLGLAIAASAASVSASSFHGYHHDPRTSARPFGPAARGKAHHTVYAVPVQVAPLETRAKRHLRASGLRGSGPIDDGLDRAVGIAAAYLSEKHGISEDGMKLKSAYQSSHNGVTHVYFRQVVNGLEVVNGDASVNIDRNGHVISSGNSFTSAHQADASVGGWVAEVEGAVLGSWEAAHEMVSTAFDGLVGEVADGFERIKGAVEPLLDGIAHRLKIQGEDGDSAAGVIDLVDRPAASHGRQRAFGVRSAGGKKASYITVKEAVRRLAHHIKDDLHPHQMEDVEIETGANLDGEPEIVLHGLPARFAVGGKASAQAALLRKDDGTVVETWDLTVEQDDHWWNAQINAQTGKVDALVDWTSQYAADPEAYRVYPWHVADPSVGARELVEDPADEVASPAGWSRDNQTAGNNVYAQSNPDGGYGWEHNFRPTSAERVFDYALDLDKAPATYIEAAVTQLFYTNNFMHDLFFHYGFDEAAGNFQDENFSGKGRGNDAVIANAQDGSGYNNANFATPPDGRHPKMRMYIWDIVSPYRDGDLEQGIVVHEYTHGISIRLTGGPANSNCLSYGEAGGMGEGWGDIFATIIRLSANNSRTDDIPMGEYSAARGIRKYPYSTSMKVNPSTYGIMDGPAYWEVHAKGEVWAEIFYEVLWNLIDANGFTADLFS
ncbi:hypothetical protein EV175_004648, partial [Coemansia sp. RSA 1933]